MITSPWKPKNYINERGIQRPFDPINPQVMGQRLIRNPNIQPQVQGQGQGGNSFLETFMNIAKQTVPWATKQLANRREKLMDTKTQGFNDLLRDNAGIRVGGTIVNRTSGDESGISPFAPSRIPRQQLTGGTGGGGTVGSSGYRGIGSFTPSGQESADYKASSDEMARKYGTYEGGQYKDPTFKPTPQGSAFMPYAPIPGFTPVKTGPGSTGLVSAAGDTNEAYNQAAESASPGITPEVQQADTGDTGQYWFNPETGMVELKTAKKKPDEEEETGGG